MWCNRPFSKKIPKKLGNEKSSGGLGRSAENLKNEGHNVGSLYITGGREPSDNYGHHSRDGFQASSEK